MSEDVLGTPKRGEMVAFGDLNDTKENGLIYKPIVGKNFDASVPATEQEKQVAKTIMFQNDEKTGDEATVSAKVQEIRDTTTKEAYDVWLNRADKLNNGTKYEVKGAAKDAFASGGMPPGSNPPEQVQIPLPQGVQSKESVWSRVSRFIKKAA